MPPDTQLPSQLPDPVRIAVREGLQDLIADPETWRLAHEGLTTYAKSEAGGFTFGVIGNLMRWILRGGAILLVLYWAGGLPAVVAFLKGGGSH